MALYDSRTGVEVIERHECLDLLAAQDVGRLAILDGDSPLILPVNYTVVDESIIFRTDEGSKLDASRGGPACFEIDGTDPAERTGWSVVVRGNLHEVDSHDQPALDLLADQAEPWVGARTHVVRLQSWSVTGRRIRAGGTTQ